MKKAEAYEVVVHSVECPHCFNVEDIEKDEYEKDESTNKIQQEVKCTHCNEYFIAIHPDDCL